MSGLARRGDLVVDEMLFDRSWCRRLHRRCVDLPFERARVGPREASAVVRKAVRRSGVTGLPAQPRRELVSRLLLSARRWERHFGVCVDEVEEPALLRYRPDGRFAPHQDGCNAPEAEGWARRRELTVVVGLSPRSEFVGGALRVFANDGSEQLVEIVEGRTAIFPSDLLHEVTPLRKGVRFVVVTWLSRRELEAGL